MKKFKKIIALGLAVVAVISAMSVSASAGDSIIEGNAIIDNGIEPKSSIVLSDRAFSTSLDATGTMVYNSDTKPVTQQYLKVWVNNQSSGYGSVYIVQTDSADRETGKSALAIANLLPNTDNQIKNVDMVSKFGSSYANYRYKVRIEGANNYALYGRVATRQGDDLSTLATEETELY